MLIILGFFLHDYTLLNVYKYLVAGYFYYKMPCALQNIIKNLNNIILTSVKTERKREIERVCVNVNNNVM